MPLRYLTTKEAERVVGRSSSWILKTLHECMTIDRGRPILIRQDTATNLSEYAKTRNHNGDDFRAWCRNGHRPPRVAYARRNSELRALTVQRASRPQRKPHSARPVESDAGLIVEIQDLKRRVAYLEAENSPNGQESPKQLEDAPDHVSATRKSIKKTIGSWMNVHYENPTAEDWRETWTWLRKTFEAAVGGIGPEVYRCHLENDGNWIDAIDRSGYLDLFLDMLPRMLPKRSAELEGVPYQQGLFE